MLLVIVITEKGTAQSPSLLPVVLSLLESGILSPRDRDLSMRTCRSSCGLEFGSCLPFSRSTGRPLGIFSFFGCDGIIVILLCLRGCPSVDGLRGCPSKDGLRNCPSDEGAAGSAGFGTLC